MNLYPFAFPLVKPFTSSLGTFSDRQGVFVRVGLQGQKGWGEASPLPGFSKESLQDVTDELTALSTTNLRWPETVQEVGDWTEDHCRTAAAQHAVASAILDAMGKAHNTPVAALLNSHFRTKIPVSYLYSGNDRQLTAATNEGTRVVKVKVGTDSVDEDVRRIRHIRERIAPSVAIRVDANGAWTEEQALYAIAQMKPLGVRSMEEPVQNRDLDAMARLRGHGIRIALDESVRSPRELEEIIALDAADAIVIKPMLSGTPMRAMEMMRRANQAGLHIWVTTTIDAAVGRMIAIHLAAAAPTEHLSPCGLNTASWLRDDVGQTPERVESHFGTPSVPGLGIEVTP